MAINIGGVNGNKYRWGQRGFNNKKSYGESIIRNIWLPIKIIDGIINLTIFWWF
jgi:hypothetical protein